MICESRQRVLTAPEGRRGAVRGSDGNLSRPPESRLQVRALNESGTLAACKMPPEIIIKCRPIYRPDPHPKTPLKLLLSYRLKALYFVVSCAIHRYRLIFFVVLFLVYKSNFKWRQIFNLYSSKQLFYFKLKY